MFIPVIPVSWEIGLLAPNTSDFTCFFFTEYDSDVAFRMPLVQKRKYLV